MAQTTAGIKLYYGTSTVTDDVPALPASWSEIPDITTTPALNATPAQIDSTTLAQEVQKTYEAGLIDLGGSFEFGANMTTALVTAVDLAVVDPGDGYARAFSIVFPDPLGTRWWWTGEILEVAPGEAAVDGIASTTLYISQATALADVDDDAVS